MVRTYPDPHRCHLHKCHRGKRESDCKQDVASLKSISSVIRQTITVKCSLFLAHLKYKNISATVILTRKSKLNRKVITSFPDLQKTTESFEIQCAAKHNLSNHKLLSYASRI